MVTTGTTIAAHGLTKRYGRHEAVSDVSFEVGAGEMVGFLGPNGAGKTTTMRMLAGLIMPTAGRAQILGEPVPSAALRKVGTMIEEPTFYPYMSGRANLVHTSLLHGGVAPRRIDEVLEFVGMEAAASKKVRAYSQGMRQRLGLARALLWEPEVLILDEPTNGLDPVGIAEVREMLRQVSKQGTTVLISSHILAEIEKIVERVLVIEAGKLLFTGPLEKLLHRLEEARVSYLLTPVDTATLESVLTEQGLEFERYDERRYRVWVPEAQASTLISELASKGVALVEATRESDNLEGAYLKLLGGDGRPR